MCTKLYSILKKWSPHKKTITSKQKKGKKEERNRNRVRLRKKYRKRRDWKYNENVFPLNLKLLTDIIRVRFTVSSLEI